MIRFQKTYKQKHPPPKIKKVKYLFCVILAAVFKFFIIFKKILSFIILKILPVIFFVIYKIFLKHLAIALYKLYRRAKKWSKNFFENSLPENKAIFLLTNRYIIHIIAILIIILVISQNFASQNVRAEDFGKTALLAQLIKPETETEEIIEEIIIPDTEPSLQNQPSFEEAENYLKNKIAVPYDKAIGEENLQEPTLTQGGTVLIKPIIGATFDTPHPREQTIEYVVKSGDTVFSIAEEYNISVNTVLWANKLSSRTIIRPGQKLKILPVTGIEHKTAKNENVGLIAKKYEVPEADILEINKLAASATLQIGQLLIIPDGEPLYAPPIYKPTKPSQIVKVPTGSGLDLFWPTTCQRTSQSFKGWRHTGIDIACSKGSPIYAALGGIVEKAGWNPAGYGYYIIIKHNDGKKTLYAHMLKNLETRTGQWVDKGQLIGYMGSTGRSTGNHLHFEVIVDGSRYNPFNYL